MEGGGEREREKEEWEKETEKIPFEISNLAFRNLINIHDGEERNASLR